jgi:mycothiol synthase
VKKIGNQMENATINPAPPNLPNLNWRLIDQNNLEAIVELAKSCYKVDGGLSFMFEPDIIQNSYFPDEPGKGIGSFMPDGRIAACASVHLDGNPGKQRARIIGLVRTDLRHKGIGSYLMRWSREQALNLLAGMGLTQGVMQVATESLTEPAHHLYLAHGFQSVFEELVMERDLRQALPYRPLPPDVTITHWRPELADQFFQAYHASFRERPGFPGYRADEWITRVTENDHKPEWSLLVRLDGEPVGFVVGNIELTLDPPGGHIWQIGVVPAQRRRGISSALLVETMRRMQREGVVAALLTVNVNNPGAIRAYAGLGVKTIGRRARYERAVATK